MKIGNDKKGETQEDGKTQDGEKGITNFSKFKAHCVVDEYPESSSDYD